MEHNIQTLHNFLDVIAMLHPGCVITNIVVLHYDAGQSMYAYAIQEEGSKPVLRTMLEWELTAKIEELSSIRTRPA